MSPRAADESTAEDIPGEPMPGDAESLPMVMDRRFKYLLCQTMQPKALTDALKAATDWVKVKSEVDREGGEGWGKDLPKGTVRNG